MQTSVRQKNVIHGYMMCLLVLAGIFFPAGISASAQDDFSFAFRSRAMMDVSFSGYGTDNVQGYYRLEDFRIGYKARYRGLEMKADIGYGGGKVAVKDLLVNCHLGNSVISAGNAYEPFSMDMLTSTVDMRFHQSASSVLAFADSRKLGITYHCHMPFMYFAIGGYTDNDINKIGENQRDSYVLTSRIVWRKKTATDRLFHLGGAFSFRTRECSGKSAELSSAGISSLLGKDVLYAEMDDAGMEFKGLLEMLYTDRSFILQAEYFIDSFERTGLDRYSIFHGGYIQAGFLVYGSGFGYDDVYAIPSRPESSRSLELVARINYTDMNDISSGVYGGEESDYSIGLNFYFNRYLAAKLNIGALVPHGNCNPFYDRALFLAQLRLQYVF